MLCVAVGRRAAKSSPSNVLSRDNRLRSDEVRHVRRSGVRKSHRLLTVYIEQGNRFAASVVVSKKVAKLANDRNLQRRRVYNALSSLNIHNKLVVVVLSPAARDASFEELETALSSLL